MHRDARDDSYAGFLPQSNMWYAHEANTAMHNRAQRPDRRLGGKFAIVLMIVHELAMLFWASSCNGCLKDF